MDSNIDTNQIVNSQKSLKDVGVTSRLVTGIIISKFLSPRIIYENKHFGGRRGIAMIQVLRKKKKKKKGSIHGRPGNIKISCRYIILGI